MPTISPGEVLTLAAVAGRRFDFALLQALTLKALIVFLDAPDEAVKRAESSLVGSR